MSKKRARIILTQKERGALVRNAVDNRKAKRYTAKAYLSQLRRLDITIRQKKDEHRRLLLLAESIGGMDYNSIRVQSSSAQDKMADKVSSAIDLEAELSQEIKELILKRHTIIKQIQSMENLVYSELLYKRYVEYKSFEVIAAEMSYTFDYTRRIHGEALQAFERSHTITHNHT